MPVFRRDQICNDFVMVTLLSSPIRDRLTTRTIEPFLPFLTSLYFFVSQLVEVERSLLRSSLIDNVLIHVISLCRRDLALILCRQRKIKDTRTTRQ